MILFSIQELKNMLLGVERELDVAIREPAHTPIEDRLIDAIQTLQVVLEEIVDRLAEVET